MSGESFEALHKANLEQRQESARFRYRISKLESAIRPERGGSFLPMPFRLMSMISYRWTNMRHYDQNQGPSVRVLRVGEQVRHVLSELLQRGDVHDDVLATHPVSVTEVRMSPALSPPTVFVNSDRTSDGEGKNGP